jgi:hypothetical protein
VPCDCNEYCDFVAGVGLQRRSVNQITQRKRNSESTIEANVSSNLWIMRIPSRRSCLGVMRVPCPDGEHAVCNYKGAIVFELKKGMFSTVKAGVLGALAATLLVACGAERAPVETAGHAHLAAASPQPIATDPSALTGEMPEVVVSAKRGET